MGVVDEPVDECGGDHLVAEDLAPGLEPAVAGDDDRTAFVATRDQREQQVRGLAFQRQVADLVDLCGYPHRSIYAETATMPRRRQRGRDAPAWDGVLEGAGGEGIGIVR